MNEPAGNAPGERHVREMTVAHLREPEGARSVEVVFLESARFYTLSASHPGYDEALELLRSALNRGSVLRVILASVDSDVIEGVEP